MILLSYGTRPEYIKIKPIIDILAKDQYRILFTGQHKDIGDFGYDYSIEILDGDNRLDSIIQSSMNKLTNILEEEKITHILVMGDTTSAFAMALSAFNHKLKVIHLEAGLRTYDNENPYPEEQNRRLISQITDIHLCPTKLSFQNLNDERIYSEKYLVGNTVLDNLIDYKDKCEYTNKILVTMHRRENHYWMDEWFKEIDKLAEDNPQFEFIIPLHPNPNVQKYKNILKNINIVEPMSHSDLLDLLIKTRLVITDSGGIQEECSFFNKKCLTCRIVTERPDAIDKSTFMVEAPNKLNDIFYEHINTYKIEYDCPFGDGHSAEKIKVILDEKSFNNNESI
jgi:UDP-N-acetylglucosamine 2-epimerase (non-hydrolysing)